MSRNRACKVITRKKEPKYSKGGCKFNRNGVPLDRNGTNALQGVIRDVKHWGY